MFNFSKQEQLIILVLIGTCFIGGIVFLIKKNLPYTRNQKEVIIKKEQHEKSQINQDGYIIIHVTGEVKKPGVYKLPKRSRIYDAINAAGGSTNLADLNKINLAALLTDAQKIYIPSILDTETASSFEEHQFTTSSHSHLININTATEEELCSLPGIGKVIAQRIIEYRTNQPFNTIEDLKKVKGIGYKKFEKIKDLVTVQ